MTATFVLATEIVPGGRFVVGPDLVGTVTEVSLSYGWDQIADVRIDVEVDDGRKWVAMMNATTYTVRDSDGAYHRVQVSPEFVADSGIAPEALLPDGY